MVNSLEILTSINKSVAIIAKNTTPGNGSGKAAVATLSRGNVAGSEASQKAETLSKSGGLGSGDIKSLISVLGGLPTIVKAIAKLSDKSIKDFKKTMKIFFEAFDVKIDSKRIETLQKADMANIISALSGIPVAVKAVSSISDKKMKAFENSILTFYKAIDKILKYKFDKKKIENIKSVNEIILGLETVVKKAVPLIIISPLATLGILLSIPFFALTMLVMKLISSFKVDHKSIKELTAGIKEITMTAYMAVGLLLACIGIASIAATEKGRALILGGLAVLAATLLTMVFIIGIVGLASRLLKGIGAMKGLKEIMLFAAMTMGLVVVAAAFGVVFGGGAGKKALVGGLVILGMTLLTMTAIILIVGLAGNVLKKSNAMKNVKEIILFTVLGFAVVVASAFLARFAKKNWKDISIGLGFVSGTLVLLVGIAWLAGKLAGKAKKGMISLAILEALALGTIGLVWITAQLAKELKKVGYKEVLKSMGIMGLILLEFGVLAGVASFIMPELILGSVALGMVELVAFGATLVVSAIINLTNKAKESGTTWKEIVKSVGGIGLVIGAFGLLAAAFSLLTIPILFATPAIALTIGFAAGAIGVVNSVIDINKKLEEIGGVDKAVETVKNVGKILKQFNKKNLSIDMSFWDFFKLGAKFTALRGLVIPLMSSVDFVTKLANISDIINDQGQMRKVIFRDPKTGEAKYGEWVDIKGVATSITVGLTAFVHGLDFSFKELKKMLLALPIMTILGMVVDPISKFVDMLTSYESDESGYLSKIVIKDDGSVVVSKKVNVTKVGGIIAGAVTTFVSSLFSDKNVDAWSKILYGEPGGGISGWWAARKRRKGAKEMMGIFSSVVEPISSFVQTLSLFEVGSDGLLHKIIEDGDGGYKQGPAINVVESGKQIAKMVTQFLTSINGIFSMSGDEDDAEKFGEVLSAYENVIKRVTEFGGDNGSIPKVTENLDAFYLKITPFGKNVMELQSSSKEFRPVSVESHVLAISFDKMTTSLASFDSVLNKEKAKRLKNIKDLAKELENLKNSVRGAGDDLRSLAVIINTLNKFDAAKANDAAEAIRNAVGASSGGGSGSVSGGSGTRKSTIVDAIKEALNGASLDTNAISTYSGSEVDDGAKAIIEALSNMDYTLSLN